MVFFLPFALVRDFTMARAVWMTVLELALVDSVFSHCDDPGNRYRWC
jgi:hypothetical protein